MNGQVKEQIINNFYELAKRIMYKIIPLEKEIIEEIFSEKKEIFEMSERNTLILRKKIGVYDNGIIQRRSGIQTILEKQITCQRLNQIIEYTILKVYKENIKLRLKKINKIHELKVEDFFIDRETIVALKRYGINIIKQLTELEEYELKTICEKEQLDYKKIKRILLEYGLKLNETRKKEIRNINMSKQTRKYIQSKGIETTEDLEKEKNSLLTDENISIWIRKEIESIIELNKNIDETSEEPLRNRMIEITKKEQEQRKRVEELEQQQVIIDTKIEDYFQIIRKTKNELNNAYDLLQEALRQQANMQIEIEKSQQTLNEIIRQKSELMSERQIKKLY